MFKCFKIQWMFNWNVRIDMMMYRIQIKEVILPKGVSSRLWRYKILKFKLPVLLRNPNVSTTRYTVQQQNTWTLLTLITIVIRKKQQINVTADSCDGSCRRNRSERETYLHSEYVHFPYTYNHIHKALGGSLTIHTYYNYKVIVQLNIF